MSHHTSPHPSHRPNRPGTLKRTVLNPTLLSLLLSAVAFAQLSCGSDSNEITNVEGTSAANSAYDDAEFLDQSVPTAMSPGQKATVWIRMRNTGTSTWTYDEGYKLGSENPRDNKTWTGKARVKLEPGEAILPGYAKTFSFEITAPDLPGTTQVFQWRMLRESVAWFGEATMGVLITIGPPGGTNGAAFVSQSVPASMSPGQKATVSITMKNTGTSTWTRDDGFKLGTENPRDNTTWTGKTRVKLAQGESIAPGQSKTFSFEITAPNLPGTTQNFQWRMLQESVAWFGEKTTNVGIKIEDPAAGNDAQFLDQSVPASLRPGEKATVWVRMRNTGTTTWTRAAGYKLGSENPRGNTRWGLNRVKLAEGESIAPGEAKTFVFEITAPNAPGTIQDFQWAMLQENVHWFGGKTINIRIPIQEPTLVNDAAFVDQSVPRRLLKGQSATVWIRMRNTGTTTWTRDAGYKLGSENPRDNTTWTGSARVKLQPGEAIPPGGEKTFVFEITAPPAQGVYNFQWRMVQEGVEWFGQKTRNVEITVGRPRPDFDH
jgi:hypothetical protein